MRIIFIDDTKLLIHNRCTSQAQESWAASVLILGIIGIYFWVSKVAENIPALWLGIFIHFLAFMFTCWYFSPVITTFDKLKNTVIIEKQSLWINPLTEYALSELKTIKYIKTLGVICLVSRPGKHLYLSNAWGNYKSCQEVFEITKSNFLLDINDRK